MNHPAHSVSGQVVDIMRRTVYPGEVHIKNGLISHITPLTDAPDRYIMPGFIDAHIHIESSMVVPYEFARIALQHGTVATVSDPHEIANVLGVDGVDYMIDNAKGAGLKFHFGAPSCVPATSFESAGATIDSEAVRGLLERDDIHYLSEMMNYPGVLHRDPEVLAKIAHAIRLNKPIDGHAPGLRGLQARQYIAAGISTDHECFTLAEAKEKLSYGMKIIIREGSAAKNFNALHSLLASDHKSLMFCSDDKHPDDLVEGHINQLVIRALSHGYDLFDVLQVACYNPLEHYKLKSGFLRRGDAADFIIVDDLRSFAVQETWINGQCLVKSGQCILRDRSHKIINQFDIVRLSADHFKLTEYSAPVIDAIDGELITKKLTVKPKVISGEYVSDIARDILKIAVINRYKESEPAIGFIHQFGLRQGAIASTVAHDSHNIIVVGVDDASMSQAANALIESKGGLSVVSHGDVSVLPLPIAGLMSELPCGQVGQSYEKLDERVKSMGCQLRAPFMTLSFMALLVIPTIKISDKGMFDAEAFEFY